MKRTFVFAFLVGLGNLLAAVPTAAQCADNLLANPGFELGAGEGWVEDPANPGPVVANSPQATEGQFLAWFGGTGSVENWAIEQTVVLPLAASASLSFQLLLASGDSADVFAVRVDGDKVLTVDASDPAFASFNQATVDLAAFADGAAHTISLVAVTTGSIYVDEMCLAIVGACDTRIDFDDTSAPVDIGAAPPLRDSYAGLGVRFTGPPGLSKDGGSVLDTSALPGVDFGSNGNKLCYLPGQTNALGGLANLPDSILFESPVDAVRFRFITRGGADVEQEVFLVDSLGEDGRYLERLDFYFQDGELQTVEFNTPGIVEVRYTIASIDELYIDDLCWAGDARGPACEDGTQFSQLPRSYTEDPGTYGSGEASEAVALESFSGLTAGIGAVRWWGVFGEGISECAPPDASYELRVYADDSGSLGRLLSTTVLTPTVIATGRTLPSLSWTEYELNAVVAPALEVSSGWLALYALEPSDCAFYWIYGQGDGVSRVGSDFDSTVPWGEDFALCLTGVPAEGEGGAEGEGEGSKEGEGDGVAEGEGEIDYAVCPGDSMLSQPPDRVTEFAETRFSDANRNRIIYENFNDLTSDITGISWWGFGLDTNDGATECVRDPNEFLVSFYADGGGAPFNIVDSFVVTPVAEPAFAMNGGPTVLRYSVTFNSPIPLSTGWVKIQGVNNTPCDWAWYPSLEGDDLSVEEIVGLSQTIVSFNPAICISGVTAEGEGEGVVEGEGIVEGEGEGVIEGEGEGVTEGEGEGQMSDPYEELLYTFASADANGNSLVTVAEILVQLPKFTQEDFDAADANDDGSLSVAELLELSSAQVILSADTSGDYLLSLSELLRAVQLYNAGGYACAANPGATEDGYLPNATPGLPACVLHGVDRNGDNQISLSELLRAIQIFSFAGYNYCDGQSEDDFCDRP